MPPRKQKKNIKKLADVLKECRISSLCSENTAPVKDENPTPGMLLDNNQNETKDMVALKTDRDVPPIFLHQPVDFKDHVQHLLLSGVKFYQPHKGKKYTKVQCLTFEDHRNLIKYSKSKKLPYHTYGNPTHRKKKVVIRGLPKNTCLNELKNELESLKFTVVRLHKMHTKQTEKEHPLLVLAVVSDKDYYGMLQVKSLLGTKVKMERPIIKTRQCHRCQKWSHSQRYCHGQTRCVKCAGDHMTSNCTKDLKTPPKCANCGGAHTASYKKCSHCPESDEYKLSQKLKLKDPKINNKLKLVTLLNYKEQLYKNIMSLAQLQDFSETEPDYVNFEEVY